MSWIAIITLLIGCLQLIPSTNTDDITVHPFHIEIPDPIVHDVWRRLADARYSTKLTGNDAVDWTMGTEPSYLNEFIDYWRTQYNWTERQNKLNQVHQYTTRIDGINIHFIHEQTTDKTAAAQGKVIPLLMLSGWLSTAHDCTGVLPYLTAAHQNVTFDVICPNLPGYIFSDPPRDRHFECRAMGNVMHKLMLRLRYDTYVVHGEDWGAAVATQMAQLYPEHVKGLHITMTPVLPPWSNKGIRGLISALTMTFTPSWVLTAEEREYVDKQPMELLHGAAYFHEQATEPYTITGALEQSPVAWANYIVPKLKSFMDPNISFEKNVTKDDMIDMLMLYWVSKSITTSTRLYYEQFHIPSVSLSDIFFSIDVSVPTGVAQFKYEISLWKAPKHILQYYYNIQHFTVYPFGGHFASLEVPDTVAQDIRTFVTEQTEMGQQAGAVIQTSTKHIEL